MVLLNLFLSTFVVVAGFWLLWDNAPTLFMAGWALAVGGFLWWKGRTMTELWAWSTLFLGLESFALPVTLMARLNAASDQPSGDEMGTVLSAVVLGLFSSVFWTTFSYGLFKRAWSGTSEVVNSATTGPIDHR